VGLRGWWDAVRAQKVCRARAQALERRMSLSAAAAAFSAWVAGVNRVARARSVAHRVAAHLYMRALASAFHGRPLQRHPSFTPGSPCLVSAPKAKL